MSYLERQKDATYITVSSRPLPDSKPDAQIVKSMSLKLAVAQGRLVRLVEGSRPGGEPPAKPADSEISKFFSRLSFRRQVRRLKRLLDVNSAGCFFPPLPSTNCVPSFAVKNHRRRRRDLRNWRKKEKLRGDVRTLGLLRNKII